MTPTLPPRDFNPTTRRKWIALLAISTMTAVTAGYWQYQWSISLLYACYDGGPPNEPVELSGIDFIGETMVSGLMAIAIVAAALIAYSIPKVNLLLALIVMVVVSVGLLWWGVGSMTTDRCPTGIPPTWPTWLPL